MCMMKLLPNWKFSLLAALVLSINVATTTNIRRPGAEDAGFHNYWVSSDDFLFDSDTNRQPRAALVAYVGQDQMHEMIDTMQRLEKAFNRRYKYDWVIFSEGNLSDEFTFTISNATGAGTFHELFFGTHQQQHKTLQYQETACLHDRRDSNSVGLQVADNDATSNWDSNLLAGEARLVDYDWFWKIEPGSQFPDHIDIDIFCTLRDHQVVYGLNATIKWYTGLSYGQKAKARAQAIQGKQNATISIPTISQQKKEHINLEAADNQPIMEVPIKNEYPPAPVSLAENTQAIDIEDAAIPLHGLPTVSGPGLVGLSSYPVLEKFFEICVHGSDFEMGSLKFLRDASFGQHHETLGTDGSYQRKSLRATRIHMLSTGISKPSDWDLNKHGDVESGVLIPEPGHRDNNNYPKPTQSTSVGKVTKLGTEKRSFRRFAMLGDPDERLPARHEKWERITNDFARQALIPGLCSGNTVVDDRNFKQLMSNWPMAVGTNLAENGLI